MIDPSKIRPQRNVVLVKLEAPPKVTEGGIHLPETTQDRQKVEHKIGTVLAVGPGKLELGNAGFVLRETAPKVGQKVVFDPPYAARVRGHDDLYLVEDDAILATVDE